MKTLEKHNVSLEYVGPDDWGRGLYKAGDEIYVDVDGVLHTRSHTGEPIKKADGLKPTSEYSKQMLHVDLLSSYEDGQDANIKNLFNGYKHKIRGFTESNDELGLCAGDVVEFTSGYNDDIRYVTSILGFDENGDAYLLWESYWMPVNLAESNVKLVKKAG